MIETTSRGCFNHAQNNHVSNMIRAITKHVSFVITLIMFRPSVNTALVFSISLEINGSTRLLLRRVVCSRKSRISDRPRGLGRGEVSILVELPLTLWSVARQTRHEGDCLACMPFYTETADSYSYKRNLGITRFYNESLSVLRRRASCREDSKEDNDKSKEENRKEIQSFNI